MEVLAGSLLVMAPVAMSCNSQQPVGSPVEEYSLQEISIEGTKIRYLDEGEGKPLLLIHGIPTSSFLWRDMIGPLTAHSRVIAVDLPGFGFSDPPLNDDYSVSSYARFLEAFTDALSLEHITLVVHDFGGPVGLTYALRHPENYERLVILDTFLHNDLPPLPLPLRIAKIRPLGELFFWLGGRSLAGAALRQGVVEKSRISDELVERYYVPEGDADKLNTTMLATLRLDYDNDLRFIEQNLKSVEKPTLILWGENDDFLPYAPLGERIHGDIQGSHLVLLAECGHFVPEDRPERAVAEIIEFLDGP
jgi:haloalkane dehalogenase